MFFQNICRSNMTAGNKADTSCLTSELLLLILRVEPSSMLLKTGLGQTGLVWVRLVWVFTSQPKARPGSLSSFCVADISLFSKRAHVPFISLDLRRLGDPSPAAFRRSPDRRKRRRHLRSLQLETHDNIASSANQRRHTKTTT